MLGFSRCALLFLNSSKKEAALVLTLVECTLQGLLSDDHFDRFAVLVRLNVHQVRLDVVLVRALLQLAHRDAQLGIQLHSLRITEHTNSHLFHR